MESSKRIHTRKTIYLNLSPLHARKSNREKLNWVYLARIF